MSDMDHEVRSARMLGCEISTNPLDPLEPILKMCEYLQGHVGEVFEGTISNVFARGFYVRLENTLEGIVRFDALHDEYHQFDPKLQTLMGEETGRTYRLGQQLRVRVRAVDPREQRVDFELA